MAARHTPDLDKNANWCSTEDRHCQLDSSCQDSAAPNRSAVPPNTVYCPCMLHNVNKSSIRIGKLCFYYVWCRVERVEDASKSVFTK
jgi:hypothetical protein